MQQQPAAQPVPLNVLPPIQHNPRQSAYSSVEPRQKDQIAALLGTAPAPAAHTGGAVEAVTILSAQQALQKLGFVIHPDGVLGTTTRQAIAMFQRDHKLAPDGELSAKVLKALQAESGVRMP